MRAVAKSTTFSHNSIWMYSLSTQSDVSLPSFYDFLKSALLRIEYANSNSHFKYLFKPSPTFTNLRSDLINWAKEWTDVHLKTFKIRLEFLIWINRSSIMKIWANQWLANRHLVSRYKPTDAFENIEFASPTTTWCHRTLWPWCPRATFGKGRRIRAGPFVPFRPRPCSALSTRRIHCRACHYWLIYASNGPIGVECTAWRRCKNAAVPDGCNWLGRKLSALDGEPK